MFYLSPPTPLLPQAPQATPPTTVLGRGGQPTWSCSSAPLEGGRKGSCRAVRMRAALCRRRAQVLICHVGLLSFRPAETLPPVSCPGTSSQSQALPTRGEALFWKVSTRAGILGPRVLPATEVPGDASCLLSWDRVSFLGAAAATICLPGLPSQGFQQKPV